MKLTTKGRYAVLALTDLAMEGDKGYVKISTKTNFFGYLKVLHDDLLLLITTTNNLYLFF